MPQRALPQLVLCLSVIALMLLGCNPAHDSAKAAGGAETAAGTDVTLPAAALRTAGLSGGEEQGDVNAPDFPAGAQWLNVDHGLSIKDLRGKIVLLDFWTYCCINCMHIIPDLKKLEAEFPDELVVVGVHSAKFNNEQQTGNIKNAILRYEIEHPVINDAEMHVWNAYTVRSWPTVVLIDPSGKIVGQRSGEGVYDALEPLLKQAVPLYDAQKLLEREKKLPLHLEKDKRPEGLLSFPGKLDVDASGQRMVVSDSNHNRIVLLSLDGAVQEVIGSGAMGLKDGGFDEAQFARPQGVCFSADGTKVYVADTENHAIRTIDLSAKMVSTLAGTGKISKAYPPEPGVGTQAALSSPWDLLLEGTTLYVAMAGSHQLWTVDTATGGANPFAGTGREDIDDELPAQAALAQPSGITASGPPGKGEIYFADSETSSIRRAGYERSEPIMTLIGEGLFDFGDVDGKYPNARLQHPIGVHWHDGYLYVADTYNHKIRRLDPKTQELTTFIGTGKPGMADGARLKAELDEPNDVASYGDKLYITDTDNGLIRIYDFKSDQLSTLKLSGTDKLMRMAAGPAGAAAAPTPEKNIALPEITVAPGAKELRVSFELPAGMHFNDAAPSQLIASAKPESGLSFGAVKLIAPTAAAPGSGSFVIPLQLENGASGGAVTLDSYVFFCDLETGGQCFFDSTRLTLSLKIAAGGSTAPAVSYKLTVPQ